MSLIVIKTHFKINKIHQKTGGKAVKNFQKKI